MNYIIDKMYHSGTFSGEWIYIKGYRMPNSLGKEGSVICFRRKDMNHGMLLLGVQKNKPLMHTFAPDQYIEPGTKPFEDKGFVQISRDEIENIITNWFLGLEKHAPLCRTGDTEDLNKSFIELKKEAVALNDHEKIKLLSNFHF